MRVHTREHELKIKDKLVEGEFGRIGRLPMTTPVVNDGVVRAGAVCAVTDGEFNVQEVSCLAGPRCKEPCVCKIL